MFSLLTLYIYNTLYLGAGSSIDYYALYCVLVVYVSYVINCEIKRPGKIITVGCIKS
jgi:hypothetical protein